MPSKAIPPTRDRLQSRILLMIALPLLCWLTYDTVRHPALSPHLSSSYLAKGAAISTALAWIVWRLRAATPVASLCGGLVCFLVTIGSTSFRNVSPAHSALTPLILLFVLTFAATRLGRERKSQAGLAENRRGRNGAQVIANLGVAAFFSSTWAHRLIRTGVEGQRDQIWLLLTALCAVPALAALAEATADTVASEIGQAVGGTPRMLTTLQSVPPGTDGAITLTGTAAGIAAAALVVTSAIPALGLTFRQAAIALAAGTAGLFADSLLGATVERRGWIGNDLVNLASTLVAALLAALLLTRSPWRP